MESTRRSRLRRCWLTIPTTTALIRGPFREAGGRLDGRRVCWPGLFRDPPTPRPIPHGVLTIAVSASRLASLKAATRGPDYSSPLSSASCTGPRHTCSRASTSGRWHSIRCWPGPGKLHWNKRAGQRSARRMVQTPDRTEPRNRVDLPPAAHPRRAPAPRPAAIAGAPLAHYHLAWPSARVSR